MDINTIWSAGLSALLGGLWFFIREKFEDVKRIERLLNITREEIARDYATIQKCKELLTTLTNVLIGWKQKLTSSFKPKADDAKHK